MSDKRVVIYTQPGCSACKNAKDYLREQGITYEDINIREDEGALRDLTEKYNSNATPTIIVGNEVIIGFDKDRIEEVLP